MNNSRRFCVGMDVNAYSYKKSIPPYPLGYAMKVVIPNEKTVAKKKMVYAWSTDGWSHPFTVFLLSWLIQAEF